MYQIHTYHPDPSTPVPIFSEPGFFFNEEAQLRQQDSGAYQLLTALNTQTRQVDARCALFFDKQLAISPKLAPFGSIEFISSLPSHALADLLDALEEGVRRMGLPSIRLINYPGCYAPQQARRLASELHRRGYRLVNQFVNHHLTISPTPFIEQLHASERRRLLKCRRANFDVTTWINPPIDSVVRFIRHSRQQQGYPLSIDPARLAHLMRHFPDQYPVLVVRDKTTVVALTVVVRVRQDILYNFLPADDLAYRTYSPTVMLTDGLYAYCQQEGITLLDLGISVDEHQQPKPGLMRFKRNLGAQESVKSVWEKQVNCQ